MHHDDIDIPRAELLLCLARAFGPPAGNAGEAMRKLMTEDLRELCTACALPVGEILDNLEHRLAGIGSTDDLLVIYSRLFLVPGDRHPSLNAAAYLDGAVGGGSMHDMIACYARCGLERHEGFHDLADHITVQLEFLAWLFAARAAARAQEGDMPPLAPEYFITRFIWRWLPLLRDDINAAESRFELSTSPYSTLSRLLEALLASVVADSHADSHTDPGPAVDPEIARLRAVFAQRGLGPDDLASIRASLAADDLASAHVAVPIEGRDAAMGMQSLTPPAVPHAAGNRPRGDA